MVTADSRPGSALDSVGGLVRLTTRPYIGSVSDSVSTANSDRSAEHFFYI